MKSGSTGTVYITPDGATNLRRELNDLWKNKRPEITRKVAAAAALGDRSDNADYTYGKKQLREIDRRIRYLSGRLDNLTVVDRTPDDQHTIYFGAWVKLADEDDKESIYRIVGSDEIDLKKGWISIDSPMARSLLKKRQGDHLVVSRPKGDAEMMVLDVQYKPMD
ncbi:MAG: transcription elongation factor GreB [Pseudomonadales bacterium]|nr:transcription elongation factor GreB [Pseudomonadales bacterium]MDP7358420.1 transcription elongation factor GreB [Pseudomonadales bacterium]MDP7594032.1 transcription elongation factor GreB [Pseudomonadales bacterium]HJN53331.1 transcription elongation factor GreB [Pseudomonadales bacterium]